MKVKDLVDFMMCKVQFYYKVAEEESEGKDSRLYREFGKPCYLYRLPKEMLDLEVEVIGINDIFTFDVRLKYNELLVKKCQEMGAAVR